MEIKISKSARTCCVCDTPFTHQDEMGSLVRVENRMLIREDYCLSCWNPERAANAFSVWTPHYYDPKVAEQQPPELFSPLRQTFYTAVESEDRVEMAVAYLAAQLLRRQKVFRLLKESDGTETEARMTLFADLIADRLIEVRDPNLTYAELETGRRALLERLSNLEKPLTEEAAEDAQEQQG